MGVHYRPSASMLHASGRPVRTVRVARIQLPSSKCWLAHTAAGVARPVLLERATPAVMSGARRRARAPMPHPTRPSLSHHSWTDPDRATLSPGVRGKPAHLHWRSRRHGFPLSLGTLGFGAGPDGGAIDPKGRDLRRKPWRPCEAACVDPHRQRERGRGPRPEPASPVTSSNGGIGNRHSTPKD